ncbi:MAG: PcfB family protein [Oscillospiraceae bacterium]|nr:PcfB family protein [Oscillospiraceae bacterium]
MEDVERRTIAISVQATKLTAQTMAKVFQDVLRQIQEMHRKAQTPQGRQSAKKLMNHGVNTSTIPLDGSTRLFDRVARKWNVDYHFRKTGPKKYLLLFKAGQADAITQCLAEYTKRIMRKDRRPSIQGQMRQAADIARNRKPQEREHGREAAHGDR